MILAQDHIPVVILNIDQRCHIFHRHYVYRVIDFISLVNAVKLRIFLHFRYLSSIMLIDIYRGIICISASELDHVLKKIRPVLLVKKILLLLVEGGHLRSYWRPTTSVRTIFVTRLYA